jgi:hypothetical protein
METLLGGTSAREVDHAFFVKTDESNFDPVGFQIKPEYIFWWCWVKTEKMPRLCGSSNDRRLPGGRTQTGSQYVNPVRSA